jgi:hypothetical protein
MDVLLTTTVLAKVDRTKITEFLRGIDGHDLLDPKEFIDAGFDPEFVKKFETVHKSGRHPKEWIFVNGVKVKSMKAVFALQFIRGLAQEIGADTKPGDSMMGRGFAYNCHVDSILKHLGL